MSPTLYTIAVLTPLLGALVAGFLGRIIGRSATHWTCIGGVGVATLLSLIAFGQVVGSSIEPLDITLYAWGVVGDLTLEVGFLIDPLTVTMMVVVTTVSLLVHIYTIGYMHDDPGYQRFFCYISLFTFAMLTLVMSNNFLQLFFGWEAVGVVSYLLIGFWYQRPSAIYANLKAFLVNRVGDLGFLLGIACVLLYFDSLHYRTVFESALPIADATMTLFPGVEWSAFSVICILLFIGAMGKSAQFPLHVWLPDSMEGPTPISALIHAATMVTAGIFMVARMSPLFELSSTALLVVMVIGAITAFFMGLLGLVQHDIKRVVAYSTLSQLGYMTVGLGASAYAASIFHLFTHAFFKALLFLGAGAVIIALHHQQDMRRMGGLYKYLPITWITSLIGSLSLIGFPGFAGFFSKESIIEAVHHSTLPGAGVVYLVVLSAVFITALYSFRMYFLVFHGEPRMDAKALASVHECPHVVTIPLLLLALPSVVIGWLFIEPMLYGNYFSSSIYVAAEHDVLAKMQLSWHGAGAMVLHALLTPALWLMILGVACAYYLWCLKPHLPALIAARYQLLYGLLMRKYGCDEINEAVFAGGTRRLGGWLWKYIDRGAIDSMLVNGVGVVVDHCSQFMRRIQSGYLYSYAFWMIIGLLLLISLFALPA